METKICTICNLEKSLGSFKKGNNRCNDCWKIYMKEYYSKNKERMNKQSREYNQVHKDEQYDKRKDYFKKRYEEKKEYILKQQKEYKLANPDKYKETTRKYCEKHKEDRKRYREEHAEQIKAYQKQYSIDNAEIIKKKRKQYFETNKEEILAKQKEFYQENKELIAERHRVYNKTHRHVINKRKKERKETDELFRLKETCRRFVLKSFQRKGYTKKSRSYEILGCDYETFIQHLLKTYELNYGEEWNGIETVHIDHIIPLAIAQTEEEVIRLSHYTNLQLLKAKDNLEKGDKLDWK